MNEEKTFSLRQACRIVDFDAAIFNQDAHNGYYPIAPQTTSGKARRFTTDEVVLLYIYAKLRANFRRVDAKGLIELIAKMLDENPDLEFVVIDFGAFSVEIKIAAARATVRERAQAAAQAAITGL